MRLDTPPSGTETKENATDTQTLDEQRPWFHDTAEASAPTGGEENKALKAEGVDSADSVPSAEIVTLDRVIDVYPDCVRLAGLAAGRAQRLFERHFARDVGPAWHVAIFRRA